MRVCWENVVSFCVPDWASPHLDRGVLLGQVQLAWKEWLGMVAADLCTPLRAVAQVSNAHATSVLECGA